MIYAVTAQRLIVGDHWSESRQVPAFLVEASSLSEAHNKVDDILLSFPSRPHQEFFIDIQELQESL